MKHIIDILLNRNSKSTKQDHPLFIGLTILNIGSGYATVEGIKQIFPDEKLALYCGFTIQMLLFLLLSRMIVKYTPLRKWVSVIFLSFLSIYTSFFTYYNTLTAPSLDQIQLDKAIEQHYILVDNILTENKTKLEQLISEQEFYEQESQREINGEGVSKIKGRGDIAISYEKDAQKRRKQIAELAPIVNILEDKLDYDTSNITDPKILFKKDQEALSRIPNKYLPEEYKKNGIKREDYINDESNIDLLEPIYMIKQGQIDAIPPLILACIIDGLSILLGTTIDSRKDKVPFNRLSQEISTLIKGFKDAWQTVIRAYKYRGIAYEHISPSATYNLDKPVEYIELTLKGKGTDFLEELICAINIDQEPNYLDSKKLFEHPQSNFKNAYKLLIVFLAEERLNWIKSEQNGQYKILKPHLLSQWLNDNINHLYEEEAMAVNAAEIQDQFNRIKLEFYPNLGDI